MNEPILSMPLKKRAFLQDSWMHFGHRHYVEQVIEFKKKLSVASFSALQRRTVN